MEQPTHGLLGWESWAAELGGGERCLRRSGDRFDCLGPQETEVHCQCGSHIERKQQRERVEGSQDWEREGWVDGERVMEGAERREGLTERATEREKDRRREGLSHQCVYVNIWTSELSFSSANRHRVRDRHWVCMYVCVCVCVCV